MLERADHWTPPDSLGYSSLRPVRLTRLGTALVSLAVFIVIGAIALGVFLQFTARRKTLEQRVLREEGSLTQAVITRLWRTNGGRGNRERGETRNHVAYWFDYAGERYSSSTQVPTGIWRGLALGTTLPVRFVPSQPAVNHPAAWSSKVIPAWIPAFTAGLLAFGALSLFIPLRRQARLLTEGRPALGRVTSVKKSDKTLVVKYEFLLLNGASAKGKTNTGKAPAVDSPLCVLYDPENPRRNAPYPLSLVRLENAPVRTAPKSSVLKHCRS